MPRSYIKAFDIILDFYESDDRMMEVDVSLWDNPKQACDSMRRCIERKRFYGIEVFRRRGFVFLMKI